METAHRLLLAARQDNQCGSTDAAPGYSTGLHIFALFLIMTCGTAACCFPTVVKAFPRLAISRHALFVSRHFGTGVLIALGFVHLIPTAFENLWNPCLPYLWTKGYNAMPGLIAMLAALAVMLVEMGFTLKGFQHTHSAEAFEERVEGLQTEGTRALTGSEVCGPKEGKAGTVVTSACSTGGTCDADLVCPCDGTQQDAQAELPVQHSKADARGEQAVESQSDSLSPEQEEKRKILQCLLLEAGILFHSVFIGLSISLSTGTTFIALCVAISFHQMFEGLALGARIAAITSFSVSNPKPWVMSFAYGLTCPLGQAIGLAVHKTYDPEGQTGSLVVGIANAISAGMIIYAGLVQLLGEELLAEKSYSRLTFRLRAEAVIALIAGCLLMATLAIWA